MKTHISNVPTNVTRFLERFYLKKFHNLGFVKLYISTKSTPNTQLAHLALRSEDGVIKVALKVSLGV